MTVHRSVMRLVRGSQLRTKLVLSYALIIVITVAAFALAQHLISPLASKQPASLPTAAAVAHYTRSIEHGLWNGLFWGTTFSVAASVITAVLVTRIIVGPLNQVRSAARLMTAGHYDTRVPVPESPDLAGIATDLNELAARLADTEQRRSQLVSDLAHELRTPVTILKGRLDGLADGIFAPSPELLTSMLAEVTRMERLTADLSQLSKAAEGAFDVRPQRVDLVALAESGVESMRQRYDEQGVMLAFAAGPTARVQGDPDRISQIIVNLLANALTASDPGGRVTVTVEDEASCVSLRVADTGHGIEPADLERIFERFERRTPPGRPEPHHGSGVGLTIARAIAHAHHGDLTAASAGPSRGAVFTLRLPKHPLPPSCVESSS